MPPNIIVKRNVKNSMTTLAGVESVVRPAAAGRRAAGNSGDRLSVRFWNRSIVAPSGREEQ